MNKMVLAQWCAIVGIGIFLFFNQKKEYKTAYLDKASVYEGFEMKKEFQKKLEATVVAREKILDSLMIDLTRLKKKIEMDEFKNQEDLIEFDIRREKYLEKEKQFTEDNNAVATDYSGQIWKQLNQYISDYGTINEYKYIFGAGGEGNIMHASEGENLTENIITYVNDKYSGK